MKMFHAFLLAIILGLSIFGGAGVASAQEISSVSTLAMGSSGATTPTPTTTTANPTQPSSPSPTTTMSPTQPTSPGTGSASVTFDNPLQYGTLQQVLGSLLTNLQGIIVTLSIVFIVIGAILYIVSAGNESRVTTAKTAITAAVIGLAIAIAAPSFLKEIYTILEPNSGIPSEVAGATSITTIVTNVLTFLLSIFGTLAIIMLVVGGLMYLTAAGDEDKIDTGKKIVLYSIIGILIALAAVVIVRQVAGFFG